MVRYELLNQRFWHSNLLTNFHKLSDKMLLCILVGWCYCWRGLCCCHCRFRVSVKIFNGFKFFKSIQNVLWSKHWSMLCIAFPANFVYKDKNINHKQKRIVAFFRINRAPHGARRISKESHFLFWLCFCYSIWLTICVDLMMLLIRLFSLLSSAYIHTPRARCLIVYIFYRFCVSSSVFSIRSRHLFHVTLRYNY